MNHTIRSLTLACHLAGIACQLDAQGASTNRASAVDADGGSPAVAAQVARDAWAKAVAALGAHDTATALANVRIAATRWPSQPTYPWARAVLAARTGATAEALDALRDYAALGLGRDLTVGTSFAGLRAIPRFTEIAAAHDGHRAIVARGQVRATINDSTFWPEGVDYDPRTGAFYVASVRYGTLAEIRTDGTVRELLPRSGAGIGSLLGVRVDTARGVLWATASGVGHHAHAAPGDSTIAALLRVRIADGAIERRWDLPPVAGGHVLGDVAVGPTGDVFVTDSSEPVLYRLRPGADTLEQIRSPLYRSLQGMAPSPDGRVLYVSDYSHGLLRVDLATERTTWLAPPAGTTLVGCDGLVWHRGSIIAVQNGVGPNRVIRISLRADGHAVTGVEVLDQNPALADEPTIGTMRGDEFVYVANSQWEKWDDHDVRVPNSRAPENVHLVGVRVPRP